MWLLYLPEITDKNMEAEHTLDVRFMEPKLKHPAIFQRFDDLLPGETFTLVNDHDPIPLYYQFQAERRGQFEWHYSEKGPDAWKVLITKVKPEEA